MPLTTAEIESKRVNLKAYTKKAKNKIVSEARNLKDEEASQKGPSQLDCRFSMSIFAAAVQMDDVLLAAAGGGVCRKVLFFFPVEPGRYG